ncbi:hypothetical protein [Actinomadura harenae]|uniref:hypothetical protein n=1 Tax=Actinomadura harenae TaxID=2483351 RepID=UPI0011C3760D|nr:hypothetical protein [Actinomadura harenae]
MAQDEVKAGRSATLIAVVSKADKDFSGAQVLLSTGASHVDLDPVSCLGGAPLSSSHGCDLKSVTSPTMIVRQSFTLAPGYVKKKTAVTVNVSLVQGGKVIAPGKGTVVFDPLPSPSPTPTSPKPTTPKPSKPGATAKPTTSKSPNTSGGGGSNNSGGGTNNTTSPSSTYTPPSTNGTFNGTNNPQVALPPISSNAPSPTVAAPDTSLASPQSTLRANTRPIAQEMSFQRVASTQIAWLAALLVACSLLLTQLRLGRRRPAPSGAAAAKRAKAGAHRRPRNGSFGK